MAIVTNPRNLDTKTNLGYSSNDQSIMSHSSELERSIYSTKPEKCACIEKMSLFISVIEYLM